MRISFGFWLGLNLIEEKERGTKVLKRHIQMPRYYCDYCHSYLTHDTLSVRKSHLIGKNHVKLTADYYDNKAIQLDLHRHKLLHDVRKNKKRSRNTGRKVKNSSLHCDTNREKRLKHKLKGNGREEDDDEKSEYALKMLYNGSPGFAKVFNDECRFDIGDFVKWNKLPQRANKKASTGSVNTYATRNTVFDIESLYKKTFTLPPPKSLAQWNTNLPPLIYADRKALDTTIHVTAKKIQR